MASFSSESSSMSSDIVRSLEEGFVVGVGKKVNHGRHVEAHTGVCVLVHKLGHLLNDFQFAHKIHCIGLCVALHKERNQDEREVDQVLGRFLVLNSLAVHLSNLERKMSSVLMAPRANVG
ncbi:hypothetical protein HG530_010192 [Fusarium avenaceum]|nr:hypothetical protein HG530_010192 [Fusarium avenaceum]